jgi:glycosyltransferase involved in cell wall biosynthesis
VASDCEGNRSLVVDGHTGLLFDPARPEALATCLERVLGDAALAESLARAGRSLVVERYDLRVLVAREIELLQRVAGGRGAHAPGRR